MSSSANLMANVALDMFADNNTTAAQSAQQASYEIMIWLATFGGSTPLGYANGTVCCTQTLNGITLSVDVNHNTRCLHLHTASLLYRGTNVRNHTTYSWLAQSNVLDFIIDFNPLLRTLTRNNLVPLDVRLGLVEFGSETFHSTKNITFSASNFTMDLQGNGKASHSGVPKIGVCWLLLFVWIAFGLLLPTCLS
jgi:xyloglucan-specific endo-beta-1,4-glucanase